MREDKPSVDVADTAFLVAAVRAAESARDDALFHDPLAAVVAGERGRALFDAAGAKAPSLAWTTVVRTVLIDRLVLEAVGRGVDTVLSLGAGLDTRAYRLDLPVDLRWLEADLEPVVAWKDAQLQDHPPACALERISVNLTEDAERRALLQRIDADGGDVLVLTEGILPYLSEPAVAAFAADLREVEPVRDWIVDYIAPAIVKARSQMGVSGAHALPLGFSPDDWVAFFTAHGFEVAERRSLIDEGEAIGRRFPMPAPMRTAASVATHRSADQASGMPDLFGYARLVPA